MTQRNCFIQVRITKEEQKEIVEGSKRVSIPSATFVRASALKEARRVLKEDV